MHKETRVKKRRKQKVQSNQGNIFQNNINIYKLVQSDSCISHYNTPLNSTTTGSICGALPQYPIVTYSTLIPVISTIYGGICGGILTANN